MKIEIPDWATFRYIHPGAEPVLLPGVTFVTGGTEIPKQLAPALPGVHPAPDPRNALTVLAGLRRSLSPFSSRGLP